MSKKTKYHTDVTFEPIARKFMGQNCSRLLWTIHKDDGTVIFADTDYKTQGKVLKDLRKHASRT